MKHILLYFFITLLLLGQIKHHKVTVIHRPLKTKVLKFEAELLRRVIKLYNIKQTQKIELNYVLESDFNKIRPLMMGGKYNLDSIFAMSTFTISNSEKFEYSLPYFPVRDSFVALKSSILSKTKIKCGYNKNPYNDRILYGLADKENYEFIPFQNYDDLPIILRNKQVDIIFCDSFVSYFNSDLQIYKNLSSVKFIGFIFPKNSPIKNMINPIIQYYTKSKDYYHLLRLFLGEEVSDYVKDTIKNKN